ncbi:hypothetical protein ACHWQZ_G014648 [Mnemiopsis leidyi]
MDVADEKWLNDYGEVESNKFNGTPSNGSLENQTRCAPLREQFYKCALNMHVDKIRDKCQFWWEDYNECLFQRKLQKKLERVEEVKEARLKEVGYKRPFWGGHTAPIFINSYPKAFNVGEPVPPEYEIGEKVNLAL